MREYVKAPDDSFIGAWLSVTPLVHDIAVSHDPFSPSTHQIHHLLIGWIMPKTYFEPQTF